MSGGCRRTRHPPLPLMFSSGPPVRRKDHGALLVLRHDTHDHVPHETSRHGIHPSAGLVQEHDLCFDTQHTSRKPWYGIRLLTILSLYEWGIVDPAQSDMKRLPVQILLRVLTAARPRSPHLRISDHGNGDGQLALIAAAVTTDRLVAVLQQAHLGYLLFHCGFTHILGDSLASRAIVAQKKQQ